MIEQPSDKANHTVPVTATSTVKPSSPPATRTRRKRSIVSYAENEEDQIEAIEEEYIKPITYQQNLLEADLNDGCIEYVNVQ
eukprot:Pgem_evm1s15056